MEQGAEGLPRLSLFMCRLPFSALYSGRELLEWASLHFSLSLSWGKGLIRSDSHEKSVILENNPSLKLSKLKCIYGKCNLPEGKNIFIWGSRKVTKSQSIIIIIGSTSLLLNIVTDSGTGRTVYREGIYYSRCLQFNRFMPALWCDEKAHSGTLVLWSLPL